ncbi:unnamed protein product [Phytomonas sp. Hart1]|nr:unnamed protein product [Phytomonas sp. Hart1]|eukprot:CCW69038.1 unnamed protein product [Phytomonas sp. isolate Hart1]
MHSSSTKIRAINVDEKTPKCHKNKNHSISFKLDLDSNNNWFSTSWFFPTFFLFLFLFSLYVLSRYGSESSTENITNKIVPYSFYYFMYCALAGALSGISHTLLLPIDILKCRLQVGRCKDFKDGIHSIFKLEAGSSYLQMLGILYRGWLPTTCGHFTQGGIKYFLYEVLKYYLLGMIQKPFNVGKEETYVFEVLGHTAQKAFGILIASCVAEIVADLALAPCEAVKLRTQITGSHSVSLSTVIHQIWLQGGLRAFYKGLIPVWCRQVPCTVIKFICFERIVRVLYWCFNRTGTNDKTEPHESDVTYLCLSLIAGGLSGMICAVISHPADTILSKLFHNDDPVNVILPLPADHSKDKCGVDTVSKNLVEVGKCGPSNTNPMFASEIKHYRHKGGCANPQELINGLSISESKCSLNTTVDVNYIDLTPLKDSTDNAQKGRMSLIDLIRSLTWKDLWRGLLLRVILLTICSSMQWVIYDSVKVLLGFPTTGSS